MAMEIHDQEPALETMRQDVLTALRAPERKLPSQYLYDERGARLFEDICTTRDYYVTRAETQILEQYRHEMSQLIGPNAIILEPGSGSGIKTRLLLEALDDPAAYVPIDIAKDQLAAYAAELRADFPTLNVLPICADFTQDYEIPAVDHKVDNRVAFMPGSTIGNFAPSVALDVLRHMSHLADTDGSVLIGVDLKKDRERLEWAYDDSDGVSAEFGLNFLVRMNRELAANFDLDGFRYGAEYKRELGRIEMFIESTEAQTVIVAGEPFEFRRGDRMITEYSYKFTLAEFEEFARGAGLEVNHVWHDSERLFSVQYLTPA